MIKKRNAVSDVVLFTKFARLGTDELIYGQKKQIQNVLEKDAFKI